MQQLLAEKNAKVSRMNDERLGTEIFPFDKLTTRWKAAVSRAIMMTSPTHHALPLALFLGVLKVDPEQEHVTLFQFGVLNNSLENVSPDQLQMDRAQYSDFMENEVLPLMQIWKDRVKAIRDEIHMQVEQEMKAETQAAFGHKNTLAKA